MWWNQRRKETRSSTKPGWTTKPGEDPSENTDKWPKSSRDKNKNRQINMTDKDKKDQEKSEKYNSSENTNTENKNQIKTWGQIQNGLITNAVRQKDIRDKMIEILKNTKF